LADLQRTVYPHKWSPISCRSSAGQGKFAGQRPTFYQLCHATKCGCGAVRGGQFMSNINSIRFALTSSERAVLYTKIRSSNPKMCSYNCSVCSYTLRQFVITDRWKSYKRVSKTHTWQTRGPVKTMCNTRAGRAPFSRAKYPSLCFCLGLATENC